MEELFSRFDPNSNLFAIMDVDKSRTISAAEFDTFFSLPGKQRPNGLWDTEDKDHDGVISFQEFSGPKGIGAPQQQQQIQSQHQGNSAVVGTGGGRSVVTFQSLDTNHDGNLSYDEFMRYFYYTFSQGRTTQKQPSREAVALSGIPDMYAQHDTNGDGRVSDAEFDRFWASVRP